MHLGSDAFLEGGDVEYQTNLNNDFSNLDIEFTVVDELFDVRHAIRTPDRSSTAVTYSLPT